MLNIRKYLKEHLNTRKSGNFYIKICTPEIISGYCLDTPPGGMYLWRFVLPSFDRLDFLHLSLGERLFFLENGEKIDESVIELIEKDCSALEKMHDPESISEYLVEREIRGDYSDWVKFLCSIRAGSLNHAEDLFKDLKSRHSFPNILFLKESFILLEDAIASGGWISGRALLQQWSEKNVSQFCGAAKS